jgi:hypothetical protein
MGKSPVNEFDMSLTYYLSGPMTGIEKHNFPAFEEATRNLRAKGFKILSAHEIDHGEEVIGQGSLPWEQYLKNDLTVMIEQAQGIVLLPGWLRSRGAWLELVIARGLGYPVLFYDQSNNMILNMGRSTS